MAVDVIRPTVWAQLDPTVTNGANGFNNDLGNRALLKEATVGQVAEYYLALWEVGVVPANSRLSVVLSMNARFNSASAPPDALSIYFRVARLDPWLLIETARVEDLLWPEQPSAAIWRQFDLTIPAGMVTSDKFELLLQFFNDSGSPSDPPVPGDPP